MVERELVSEMLDLCSKLMQLMAQEDVIDCNLYEGFEFNMLLDSTLMHSM
jgi:hypothetical protein